MALPVPLIGHLENELSTRQGKLSVDSYSPVPGGSINQVYRLETTHGQFLLKLNSNTRYPGMFAREAAGLNAIVSTKTIPVPGVICSGDFEDQSFLVLEWIESRPPTTQSSEALGQQLAAMHRTTARSFGFDTDNYMGSLHQSNAMHPTWQAFYVFERLQPMVKMAFDRQYLNPADLQYFDLLYHKLGNMFDEEPSALIHGDLWSGNYLISPQEQPYLIDPAISYGHREFDIAMTTLFGGFDRVFYNAYHEAFPLPPGWQQRLDLWNLYPLLVHLNLGQGYLGQVRAVLKTYL